MLSPRLVRLFALFALPASALAQEPATDLPVQPGKLVLKAQPVDDSGKPLEPAPEEKMKERKDLDAAIGTLREARTLKLEIAAPRGQIVDRNGIPFAQNRVVNYLALNFPILNPATDEAIIAFARARMGEVNALLGKQWDVPNDRIVAHYKDRRWLPLVFSVEAGLSIELSPDELQKLKPMMGKGLMLHPTFLRVYPKNDSACHIIGYTGRRQPLPVGPINEGEPLIEEPIGRAGLELSFENDLRGKPGMINLLFNTDGSKLNEEVLRRPVPGNNVVTTLDYGFQIFAETALKRHAINGGAMVIMDVRNGDILAMASNPGFDLNEFIPGMSKARFEELKNDPREPLGGRAYQGNYFPASTFKIVTALAGLESNKVPADKFYFCDTSFTIGDRTFHNWNTKSAEGDLNVVAAIKRSCNTFFYQAAMDIGTTDLIGMAERMGFGVPTGIPLAGEAKGFVPTDAFYQQRYKHRILPGILASISIGQVVEASPLQVAQCMATVADGTNMPKVRLVKQVQDFNDNVIQAWPPEVRKQVGLRQDARDTVVKGMIAVVNSDGGTGHNAQVEGVQVAGKTGTAQWKLYPDESKNRRLAWFTGFLPAQNPLYAFAVVYEGAPGENVSGGAIAAPVVQEVFEKIYKNASPEDDLILMAKEAPRAEIVDDTVDVVGAPKAEPVAEAPQPTEQPKTVGGFFRRLFGGSRQ